MSQASDSSEESERQPRRALKGDVSQPHAAKRGFAVGRSAPLWPVHRRTLRNELLLALLPTMIVLGILIGLRLLAQQRILFASLATSAFLIYRDPRGIANRMSVFVPAHLIGLLTGLGVSLILGSSYAAAAVAMALTIFVLVLMQLVYSPAIATSLIFAFREQDAKTAALFVLALVMLVALVVMQRGLVLLMSRLDIENLDSG